MKHRRRGLYVVSVACLLLAVPETAFGHHEDYIDETFVFLTLDRGAFEPEYWLDIGAHDRGSGDFVRQNASAEYGLTKRWMADGRGTLLADRGSAARFESGRVESRYRFGEEGELPIDLAASAEVSTNRDVGGDFETAIEPRLVLSKDFNQLNLTLNLVEEIPLKRGHPGFAPSLGVRYGNELPVRIGSELKYSTESKVGAVTPQIWFAFPHELTLKVGFSRGLDRNREDFGRLVLETEF